jgi:alanine racemase
MQQYSTWLEIDLGAVQNNVRRLRAISGRPVLAVIKANGYGHGIVEMARAAWTGGAAWLGVARINEALALREAGIDLPVLVLGYCSPEWVSRAIQERIHLTVHHPELAAAFSAQAAAVGGVLGVHAKFDTGMGRLGVFPEDGVPFIRGLHESAGLRLEGVFTHLARADEPEADTTDAQLDRFDTLIAALQAEGLRPGLVHAANSAATLFYPRARFDVVRPGIAIYGLHPSMDAPLPEGFRPALAWKARLISVKNLPAGHGVGYNFRYITQRDERIGVIPVGYADGFRRRIGNFALVRGKRVAVVGGVCMDQCMLQLDAVPEARAGDEVVLIGAQGEARITAEEVGAAWGTVNYDVVCGLAARVPRVYGDFDVSPGENQTLESA